MAQPGILAQVVGGEGSGIEEPQPDAVALDHRAQESGIGAVLGGDRPQHPCPKQTIVAPLVGDRVFLANQDRAVGEGGQIVGFGGEGGDQGGGGLRSQPGIEIRGGSHGVVDAGKARPGERVGQQRHNAEDDHPPSPGASPGHQGLEQGGEGDRRAKGQGNPQGVLGIAAGQVEPKQQGMGGEKQGKAGDRHLGQQG